jgi:YHS domain-containing protein
MRPPRLLIAAFSFFLIVLATLNPVAAQSSLRTDINTDATGLALGGYDPVAYFTVGKPIPGDASITAAHDGATFRFSSIANRDAFFKEPARYVPAFGGFCAYGVSQGYKVKIDPTVFRVIDGKLYLNYDASVGKKWNAQSASYIRDANAKWQELQSKPRN